MFVYLYYGAGGDLLGSPTAAQAQPGLPIGHFPVQACNDNNNNNNNNHTTTTTTTNNNNKGGEGTAD